MRTWTRFRPSELEALSTIVNLDDWAKACASLFEASSTLYLGLMASSSAAGGKAERGNAARGRGKDGGNLESGSLKRKIGIFNKDLRLMMYGFGDDPDPIPETVELVEDILVNYITDMVHKSAEVATRRGKLQTDDVVFLIRKDARKFARVKELLHMHKELKRARKAFEVDEEKFKDEV